MTAHLTSDTVVAYRARRLPPSHFLAADRHVATCQACAAAVAAVPVDASVSFAADDAETAHDHLTYETLEALVDARVSDVDREIADAHLETCDTCRAALADLAAFRDTLTADARRDVVVPMPPRFAWRRYVLPAAAAAVFALALLVPRPAPPPVAPAPETPSAPTSVAPPAPSQVEPAVSSAPSAAPAATTPVTPSLDEPRRSATRTVAGKPFRFEAGVWIDTTYDRGARLPEVRASTAAERTDLVARVPALAPFAALGRQVIVVVDGTAYVIDVRD